MISRKKSQEIAKSLCKKCCTPEGYIEPNKVDLVLNALAKRKPSGYSAILKALKRQIESVIARELVVVEAAQVPPNWKQLEKFLIAKTGATRVVFEPNPDLVFGAKISHGDWIWEQSLDSKLTSLAQSS